MARLPQPGQDSGIWGNVLNDFLSQAHDADGSLKDNSVDSAALAPGAVSASEIQNGSITTTKLGTSGAPSSGQVLAYDGTALTWSTPSGSGSVPDANASTKGLIQLTGDLGGTATSPTVPGLAAKAPLASPAFTGTPTGITKAHVGLGNVDDTSDANKPISSATQTALDAKATDSVVVHNTGAETIAGVKTFSSLPVLPATTPTTSTQAATKGYADSAVAIYANLAPGSTITVTKSGGIWPSRPTARTDVVVIWKGPDPSPAIVSSGTGGMLDNVDMRFVTS